MEQDAGILELDLAFALSHSTYCERISVRLQHGNSSCHEFVNWSRQLVCSALHLVCSALHSRKLGRAGCVAVILDLILHAGTVGRAIFLSVEFV